MVYIMLEEFGNVAESKMYCITGGSGLVEVGPLVYSWAPLFVQFLFHTLLRVIKQSPFSLLRISLFLWTSPCSLIFIISLEVAQRSNTEHSIESR